VAQSIEKKENLSARLLLRQRLHRLRLVWRTLSSPNTKPILLIILCGPRSGSTLLAEYLNQHEQILDCGEVLNQRISRGLNHRKVGPKAVIRQITLTMLACSKKVCMIKIHFNHLDDRKTDFQQVLEAFPESRVILLSRQSILSQYCSQVIATQTRHFRKTSRNNQEISFDLQFADWEYYRAKRISESYNAATLLRDLRKTYFSLNYEELTRVPIAKVSEIFVDFLLLEKISITRLVSGKQENRQIHQIISNWDEVREFIKPGMEE
jgi:LPS sulfotransferase NodH